MVFGVKKIPAVFFTLILVHAAFSSQGQSKKFLLLQHGSKEKSRITFEIGEEISYKTRIYDFYVTDVVVDIQPDLVVLKENILKPAEITAVDIRNKDPRNGTIKNMAYLGMGAGALLLLATTVNSLVQHGDLSETGSLLPVSGGLILGGFIISKLQYREFKHAGRNKIQAVILYGD